MFNIENFKNIDVKFCPVPFWSWNDKLNDDELCRQIEEMAEKGMGGFFMHPRVGLVTAYNSPEWFHAIDICVKKAKEQGIDPWLYDEDRWPSGYGGGEVTIIEEYRQRALLLLEKKDITENDTIVDSYKTEDKEYFIVKRISPLGDEWYNGTCYVDLMNKNAVKKFLEVTHERYKKNNGQYFGKEIPGIFTDEPNFLSRNNFKCHALPWSECLEEYFFERHGYNISGHLKELFFKINDYRKVRHDFFDSASNLMLESFTKQYYKWCDENNLKMTGHFMAEDTLSYQIGWCGFIMPHYEFMHQPGIDKLGRRVNQNTTVKQLSSVAEQLSKERTLSEVYGCIGQHCGFKERKWLVDWQAVLGVNFVNPHLSLYSMRGERKRDFPANLYYQQPYWKEEKVFSDYVARISKLVSQGKRETEILVIHPVASGWCDFESKAMDIDTAFSGVVDRLIEENLDFHFGDEYIMENHARISDDKIKIGDYSYKTVVVPFACTLRQSTVDLLNKMNGNIVFISPYPTRINGAVSENFLPENAFYTSEIEEGISYVSNIYDNRIKTIDKLSGKNSKKIYVSTRMLEDEKTILFANIEPTREIQAQIIIKDEKTPYMLDLKNGKVHNIKFERRHGEIHIDALFYGAGSLAILLSDKAYEAEGVLINTDDGVEFTNSEKNTYLRCSFKDMEFSEENVMPINNATIYINGEKMFSDMPIAKFWNECFYRRPDGEEFACEYKFSVENYQNQSMTSVIECAENLDLITLNGQKLTPLKKVGDPDLFNEKVNYKDIHFVRVPLENVKNGENILRIEGKKINNTNGFGGHRIIKDFKAYNSTELDAIYILGDFIVTERDNSDFSIDFSKNDIEYKNISDSGYPFYSGTVKYTFEIDYKKTERCPDIRLNTANCTYAKLTVNSVCKGIKYMRPFIFSDISLNDGKNIIEIEITGTLFNLMGPNWIDGVDDIIYISPLVFSDDEKFTKKYRLMPLGIKSVEIIE